MTFKKILVPINASVSSSKALALAIDVARVCGEDTKLLLLHIVHDFHVYNRHQAALMTNMRTFLVEEGQSVLKLGGEYVEKANVQFETILETDEAAGMPDDVIIRTAKSHSADLVLMGTHGRNGFDRFVLGSVAEGVLRRSPVPVVVVRTPNTEHHKCYTTADRSLKDEFARILVPVDGSEYSTAALERVLPFAKVVGAQITLLYNIRKGSDDKSIKGEAVIDDAMSVISSFDSDIKVVPMLLSSSDMHPAEAVVEKAKEGDFNMICMGSRGRDGVTRALLGSVTEKVVRQAHIPVMVYVNKNEA